MRIDHKPGQGRQRKMRAGTSPLHRFACRIQHHLLPGFGFNPQSALFFSAYSFLHRLACHRVAYAQMHGEFADLAESPAHLAVLCYHDELVSLYVYTVLGRIRNLSMQVLTKYFANPGVAHIVPRPDMSSVCKDMRSSLHQDEIKRQSAEHDRNRDRGVPRVYDLDECAGPRCRRNLFMCPAQCYARALQRGSGHHTCG